MNQSEREALAKRLIEELKAEGWEYKEKEEGPSEIPLDQRLPIGTRVEVVKVIDNPRGLSPLIGTHGVVVEGRNHKYIWAEFAIPEAGLPDSTGYTWIYDEDRSSIISGFLPDEIAAVDEDTCYVCKTPTEGSMYCMPCGMAEGYQMDWREMEEE